MWIQQDSATANTAKASLDTLKAKFSDRLISQKTAFPWPARSPDLSPLDFFLWGFLKGRIYRVQPQTLTELKDSISEVLGTITPELCQQVIANMRRRLQLCDQLGGRHFEHLL